VQTVGQQDLDARAHPQRRRAGSGAVAGFGPRIARAAETPPPQSQ
jgi:hypothetical protein